MKKVSLNKIIDKNSQDKLKNYTKKLSSTLPNDSWLERYKSTFDEETFQKFFKTLPSNLRVDSPDYNENPQNLNTTTYAKEGGDISIPDLEQDVILDKYRPGGQAVLNKFYKNLFENVNKRADDGNATFMDRALGSLETVFEDPANALKFLFTKKRKIDNVQSNPYDVDFFSNQRGNTKKTWMPKYYADDNISLPSVTYIPQEQGYPLQNESQKTPHMYGWFDPLLPGGVQGGWHRKQFPSYKDAYNFWKTEHQGKVIGPRVTFDPIREGDDLTEYSIGGQLEKVSKDTWITKYKNGGSAHSTSKKKKDSFLDKFIPKYDDGGKPCPEYYVRDPYTGDCVKDPSYEHHANPMFEQLLGKSGVIDKNNVVIDYVDPKTGKTKQRKIDRRSKYYRSLVEGKALTGTSVDEKGQLHTQFNTEDGTPITIQELKPIVIDGSNIPLKEGSVGRYSREFRRKHNFKDYIKEKVEAEKREAFRRFGNAFNWNEAFNNGAIERATNQYYQEMNDYAARGLRKFNKREEGQDVADWLDEFTPRQRQILFSESGSEDLGNTYNQDAAERTRRKVAAGDENATYTFPDYYDNVTGKLVKGQTKAWKDMSLDEQYYVTGQNLSGWGQFNKEEDGEILPYLNYINPLTIIPAIGGQMAQVPYRTITEKSPMPLLGTAANIFLAGKLASLKTFNPFKSNFYSVQNFTHKPTTYEFANNLFSGVPALSKGTYNFGKEFIKGSIKNKALTFPKFNPFVRVEPSNFSLTAAKDRAYNLGVLTPEQIETTTGNFFTVKNPKRELFPYFKGNEVKGDGQRYNIIGEASGIPGSKMHDVVHTVSPEGHYLPDEALTMSHGLGDFKNWKEVQKAYPEFTDAEIAILEKSYDPKLRQNLTPEEKAFAIQTENKVRKYPDLINKTETVVKPHVAQQYRNSPLKSNLTADEVAENLYMYDNPFKNLVLTPVMQPLKKGIRGIGTHAPVSPYVEESKEISTDPNNPQLKRGGQTNWLNKYKQA